MIYNMKLVHCGVNEIQYDTSRKWRNQLSSKFSQSKMNDEINSGNENSWGTNVIAGPTMNSRFSFITSNMRRSRLLIRADWASWFTREEGDGQREGVSRCYLIEC